MPEGAAFRGVEPAVDEPRSVEADPAERLLELVDLSEVTERTVDTNWHEQTISAQSARAAAVAQLRRYADLLERGELDGVRMQWREGLHCIDSVELDGRPVEVDGKRVRRVRLLRYEIQSPERPPEPPEPYDRG